MRLSLLTTLILLMALIAPGASIAAPLPEHTLILENHQFSPAELKVSAGKKFRLVVVNRDPSPEEFESYDFNREKIVPAGGRIVLYVGPLRPGRYQFFGEFHQASARGALIAE